MARALTAKPAASKGSGSLRLLLMLVLLGLAVMWYGRRASGPETGIVAQDFSLPVVSGGDGQVVLSSLRGSPVLIEVVATWCGVCRRSAPTLAAASRLTRKRAVRFVAVSVDDQESDARLLARDWNIPYEVAHDDGHFAKSYGITLLPTFVVIDADGRIAHVSSGAPGPDDVEEWLAEVGAERL